jgi:2,5-diketo-D-gluconate reductase A
VAQVFGTHKTLLSDGKVRAIGVSNFMPDHLERLLDEASVVPAVNQVEVHPYFSQPAVQAADAAHGILIRAWSPIGGIMFYRETGASVLTDPVIAGIAKSHEKSRLRSCFAGTVSRAVPLSQKLSIRHGSRRTSTSSTSSSPPVS